MEITYESFEEPNVNKRLDESMNKKSLITL